MKSRKVSGTDRITAEALKAGGQKMAEMLLKICNAAWHQEKLPTYWCRSMINSIHKKACKLTPSSFRAISLIFIPGKVYCKMILMRIDDDIDAHLSKQQFGFRKKRGTVDAIFIVRQIMEKANEHQVLLHLICVDSKAALYTNWKYVEAYCGGSQDCISD